VSFPEATTIGGAAFYGCTSLITASFPEATSIGNSAFYNCTSLTTASFPEATSIGEGAFSGCTALTTVSIPKVTSIGYYAFAASGRGLLTITMGAYAPTVGYNSFASINGSRTVTIRVPSGATGYDATWQNAFKGLGNAGGYDYSNPPTVNSYINFVFEYY
jgi:hypothetical protein